MDWSEQRPHVGGALGAALFDTLLERDWIRRGNGRAVLPTEAGKTAFIEEFGVSAAVFD